MGREGGGGGRGEKKEGEWTNTKYKMLLFPPWVREWWRFQLSHTPWTVRTPLGLGSWQYRKQSCRMKWEKPRCLDWQEFGGLAMGLCVHVFVFVCVFVINCVCVCYLCVYVCVCCLTLQFALIVELLLRDNYGQRGLLVWVSVQETVVVDGESICSSNVVKLPTHPGPQPLPAGLVTSKLQQTPPLSPTYAGSSWPTVPPSDLRQQFSGDLPYLPRVVRQYGRPSQLQPACWCERWWAGLFQHPCWLTAPSEVPHTAVEPTYHRKMSCN